MVQSLPQYHYRQAGKQTVIRKEKNKALIVLTPLYSEHNSNKSLKGNKIHNVRLSTTLIYIYKTQ